MLRRSAFLFALKNIYIYIYVKDRIAYLLARKFNKKFKEKDASHRLIEKEKVTIPFTTLSRKMIVISRDSKFHLGDERSLPTDPSRVNKWE